MRSWTTVHKTWEEKHFLTPTRLQRNILNIGSEVLIANEKPWKREIKYCAKVLQVNYIISILMLTFSTLIKWWEKVHTKTNETQSLVYEQTHFKKTRWRTCNFPKKKTYTVWYIFYTLCWGVPTALSVHFVYNSWFSWKQASHTRSQLQPLNLLANIRSFQLHVFSIF